MQTFDLQFSDLSLNLSDIYVGLGYGNQTPDKCIKAMLNDLIRDVSIICHPKIGYSIYKGHWVDKQSIEIDGISIKIGPIISKYLQLASMFGVFVATAGNEFDEFLQEKKRSGDIVTEFLADAIGSEITEAAVRYATEKISNDVMKTGLTITNPYSPGYCGWHVREQIKIFSFLPENPCGIKLNDSCLMLPVKSVSGIVGMGVEIKKEPYGCDICGLMTCYKRKR